MKLANDLLHQIADQSLTRDERARLRCKLAKQLEGAGNYEAAREAMGELWPHVGERPVLEELDYQTSAEVLLRVGALTGWIGSAKQIEGAQATAKDLISESQTLFGMQGDVEKIAEAKTDLAYCHWREGAFDEARTMLQEALSHLDETNRGVKDETDGEVKDETNREVKALALLRSAIVDMSAKRFNDALRIYVEASPLFEKVKNHALKAQFHIGFANVLNYLSAAEYREDYVDQALIEYTAASFHFEQAGHTRYQAGVENNLAFLFSTIGKFPEAHEHLVRAQALFTTLKDSGHLAQVDDTRAKVLLAEGRVAEAEKLVRSAVRTLERGGEQSLLAEALTTHGMALARSGRHEEARATLRRAVEVAEQAGDQESAGQAALTLIEESGAHLSGEDLCAAYERAAELLDGSQNLSTFKRLSACARRVLFLMQASPLPPDWKDFSLKDAVRRYESRLIERALKESGGLVTRAAQLLGFSHHQSLIHLLKSKHKSLAQERAPAVPRRRSIIRMRAPYRTSHCRAERDVRPVTILHVEDNKLVSDAVRGTLEAHGWAVEVCADGGNALNKLAGGAHYDLLLIDQELPGASGMEIARYARCLPHRRQTPILMFSATGNESEAKSAGVDAFLRKPADVSLVIETIERLLADTPAVP